MIKVADPSRRGKYGNAHTGTFFPTHPEKYTGEKPIVYKSGLELAFMKYADRNPMILQWGYENATPIKYLDHSTSPSKVRRYYVDFVCRVNVGGRVKTVWIEIKSSQETRKPKKGQSPKTITTWIKNTCKWQAARMLAESKGYEFKILTEKELV